MNLMIQNDKKGRTISEMDVFDMNGNITEGGKRILGGLATKYLSFMRGENPISFPIRLFPENIHNFLPKNSSLAFQEWQRIIAKI